MRLMYTVRRGRHLKRYSDKAALRFCVMAERSGLIEIVLASYIYRSDLIGIVIVLIVMLSCNDIVIASLYIVQVLLQL
jgi:hypothetical protein